MYCYKCGKFMQSTETLCPECKAQTMQPKEQPVEEVPQPVAEDSQQPQQEVQALVIDQTATTATPQKEITNKAGIVGCVTGVIAMFLSIIALVVSAMGLSMCQEGVGTLNNVLSCVIFTGVFLVAMVPFVIVSLVNGIKGIKNFKLACKLRTKKPIVGFVLGIGSVSVIPATLLMGLYALIFSAVTLSLM